jgi:hypothetical protein
MALVVAVVLALATIADGAWIVSSVTDVSDPRGIIGVALLVAGTVLVCLAVAMFLRRRPGGGHSQ